MDSDLNYKLGCGRVEFPSGNMNKLQIHNTVKRYLNSTDKGVLHMEIKIMIIVFLTVLLVPLLIIVFLFIFRKRRKPNDIKPGINADREYDNDKMKTQKFTIND